MQLKQLITSARQYLQDNGYAASTIYHNYVWHWNTFLKSVGDSEYSYGLLTGYVTRRFSRNLFQSAVSDMKRDEYRNYHALLALNTFHDEGVMPGTSMSGASIRQPLTEMSNKAFHLYMDSLELLEYTHNSKRQAKTIVHAFLLACPIEDIDDNAVLDYLVGLGKKGKSTVKSELKLLKRFLYFAWKYSITERDYSTLLISTKKRKNTDIPSVYSPAEVVTLLNYLASHGRNRLRNFAIALLIAVYGFRAGDIAKMKLADRQTSTGIPAWSSLSRQRQQSVWNTNLPNFAGKPLQNTCLMSGPTLIVSMFSLRKMGNHWLPLLYQQWSSVGSPSVV